jgi:hypothetical protein
MVKEKLMEKAKKIWILNNRFTTKKALFFNKNLLAVFIHKLQLTNLSNSLISSILKKVP